MAYGSPERLEDVPAYYTHIRRGSPPSLELLDELVGRYRAIGGPTPLNRITRRQAGALEAELARRGHAVPVVVGFKHVAPFVADAVEEIAGRGVERAVGLVLAPHYSLRSVAEYTEYATAAGPKDMTIDVVSSWHDHPRLIEALAARLERALDDAGDPLVVFTAHSVPLRSVESGDPYPLQVAETARLVAGSAGLTRWKVAYQSAGRTSEPWIGPDIAEVVEQAAAEGERALVVHPIGFVSDHLEVLYDVDVEARGLAARHGVALSRPAMPNDDPDFVVVLAEVVAARLENER